VSNQCEQCKWWHRLNSRQKEWENADITMGECHGAPPTAQIEVSRINPSGLGMGRWTIHYNQGYFPTTSVDDYCANFQKKE